MTRTWWALALAVWAAPVLAQPCANLAQPCGNLVDDTERLGCYDRLAACVTTHEPEARLACYDAARPPAAQPDAEPRGEVARPGRADEVFPLPGKVAANQDERVTAEVVKVQTDARGLHYLTFDNGQIWRELSKGRVRFAPGDRVELSHGVLGSVNLRVEGRTGYIKVRRVE